MGVAIPNATTEDDLDEMVVPTRPDGTYYRFEMVADAGRTRYYEDDPAALLAHLIPGYEELDQDERLAARIRHATDMQVRMQALINIEFDQTPTTSTEFDILTGPRHEPPTPEIWSSTIPLVLVDAFYKPYTDQPAPASTLADVAMPDNIWWLTPVAGDFEYLRSLHQTTVIDLHMTRDEVI